MAGGGKVTSALAKLRKERLLDENPGITRIIDDSRLDYAVDPSHLTSEALITLDPQEYLDLAAIVAPNYQGIFKGEARKLGKEINTKNKMHSLPELGLEYYKIEPNIGLRVARHDGRHRAQMLGDKGYKVPTILRKREGTFEGLLADWLAGRELTPELTETRIKEGWKHFPMKKRAFADGGYTSLEHMLKTSDDSADDPELDAMLNSPESAGGGRLGHYLLKGLATNIGDINDDGHLEPSMRGFADSIKSLAATPALLDVVLPRAPFKASNLVPQWAWDADERKGNVRARIEELTSKHGPDSILDAVGEMVTQVPLPISALRGAKILNRVPTAAKPVKEAMGSMLEYLSPTVDPSTKNYLKGSAAGALFNEATDMDDSELEQILQQAGPLPSGKLSNQFNKRHRYAGGGRVHGVMHRIYDSHTKSRVGEPYLNKWDAEASRAALGGEDGRYILQPVQHGVPEGADKAQQAALRRNAQLRDTLKPIKKAGGGKVTRTARSIKAIKDAIAHLENRDNMSAIRALHGSDLGNDAEITEVIRQLKGPLPPTIGKKVRGTLDKAVSDDTNTTIMPLLGN